MMIKLKFVPLVTVAIMFVLVNNLTAQGISDCKKLPITYSSFPEAVKTIKATRFLIEESISTLKSSWIRGASYFSCDGRVGFFILKTDKKEYLYSNLPIEVWKEFKGADSFGSYYNAHIKNRYLFELN